MEGFTIKCNECGKETIVTMDSDGMLKFNNRNVSLGVAGYDGQLSLGCICGDELEED